MSAFKDFPRPDPDGLWSGPECCMCHGTGVSPYAAGSGHGSGGLLLDDVGRVWAACAACNGHGREPNG
jgi:hypothetical protein